MKLLRIFATALLATACATGALAQLKLPPGAKTGPTGSPAPVTAPADAGAALPKPSSENAAKEEAGKLAAAGWLVLLDRKDWGRAWETSASMFQKNVTLGSWMDGIPKVRDPLGAFVERSPAESIYKNQLAGQPDGEYVSVHFASKFANREVQELVTTVRDTDGRWRVTGYSAQ